MLAPRRMPVALIRGRAARLSDVSLSDVRVSTAPPAPGCVLSPSDLAAARDGALRDVGGRISSFGGDHLILADAFAECRIAGALPRLEPGSWVLLRCRWQGGEWRAERLLTQHPGSLRAEGQRVHARRRAPILAQRQRAERLVRDYFDSQGFVEVHTPVRVAAPGTDVYLEPHRTQDGWLITSPEFHLKRLLAGGMPRIYELAVCTRNDEAGLWHQPEFVMLEWYRAFAGMEALFDDTEQLISLLARQLCSGPVLRRAELEQELTPPFERITVREAFRRYAGVADVCDLAETDEDTYFQLLVDRVEPALCRHSKPVFLYDYPVSQAALAQRKPGDDRVAERCELYLLGVELCNGYVELTDPREQRDRFERDRQLRHRRRLPELPVDEGLLSALKEGMPPAAGNALGFERLIALLLGVPLERVVAFPKASDDVTRTE